MEREIMLTGVGGQGVQLSAQILARAAAREGRSVQMLGTYGGMMRGGNTDSTIVVADDSVGQPPIISKTWSAIAMHHQFFAPLEQRLRPEAVVVLNSTLFEGEPQGSALRIFEVPATEIARDLGAPMAASLVLAAAYAGLTGLVGLDSLIDGMRESVPSYRRQHLEDNERALRTGFPVLPAGGAPAWLQEGAAA